MRVEKSYEELLHGMPGNESVEADAFGNVLRHLGRKDPIRGNDLIFIPKIMDCKWSLQSSLQIDVVQLLAIDPRTGEILALAVSSPSFNLQLICYRD